MLKNIHSLKKICKNAYWEKIKTSIIKSAMDEKMEKYAKYIKRITKIFIQKMLSMILIDRKIIKNPIIYK